MEVLVIKVGAMGDVVRTAILVDRLKRSSPDIRITWYASSAEALLKYIYPDLVDEFCDLSRATYLRPDVVLSFEEESELVKFASLYKHGCIRFIGFFLDQRGNITYTLNTSAWNDMGIQSRFGRRIADELKRSNKSSFLDIWTSILCLENPKLQGKEAITNTPVRISIAPWSADRWPSKRLPEAELESLLFRLEKHPEFKVVILGIPPDDGRQKNYLRKYHIDTKASVSNFLWLIRDTDILVTADSLAVHVAAVYSVHTVSFYAPTSAAEVDVTDKSIKITSISEDYCSYQPNASNQTLTADRIYGAIREIYSELSK